MSFPAYPEYKDSGFQWLSMVPSSWSSVPFGMLFRRIKRTDHGDEELLSVYRDYGVIRKSDRDDNFNNPSDDLSSYQLVEPGDLAMNKMKAWQGSLGVSDLRGIVSPAYFVFSPRKQFHPAFMHYLLRSPPYAAGYMTISKGIRINQWDVDPDHLTSLPVLFPSIAEQQAIASFLDRETAKIDALVAEQERLIALLKEKRQAVISRAVTKGLKPDAPMKDSGVEWLGEIPAHWETVGLKRLGSLKSGEAITSDAIEGNGEFPVYGGNGFRGFTDAYTHEGEVVLVGRQGALCGNVNYASGRFWASEHALVLNPLCEFSLTWMGELLRHMNLGQYSQSAAQPGISAELVSNLQIPVPPYNEQVAIAQHLEETFAQIDAVIATAETAIRLLKERRAALISAAVSGKIDVRGLVERHEVDFV